MNSANVTVGASALTQPKLPMGSTIGILGGGQLGRMLALAAAKLGMKSHIYCPEANSPAFQVTPHTTIAAYDDETALAKFAAAVDCVTYEFENVPAATAAFLSARTRLAPNARALEISQDRLREKQFLADLGINIARFAPANSAADLHGAVASIGLPSVLKTTRFGYDGKGQHMLRTPADVARASAEMSKKSHYVLEQFVPFDKEISVIIARNAAGQISAFDPAENVHRNHILHTSTVPAHIDQIVAEQAISQAEQIAHALDYCGVMGIEFFVKTEQETSTLIVNEIAPRVHNSGHWTEAVCVTDQFEQHVRAICNWPLGPATRLADVVMENLIGSDIDTPPVGTKGLDQLHAYGKEEIRPGRKMGHVNHVIPFGPIT